MHPPPHTQEYDKKFTVVAGKLEMEAPTILLSDDDVDARNHKGPDLKNSAILLDGSKEDQHNKFVQAKGTVGLIGTVLVVLLVLVVVIVLVY